MGGRAVELLGQASEMDLLQPQSVDRSHHLDEGAAKAIELPDHQLIGRTQVGEGGLEFGPLGAGFAALFLLEDFFAAGLQKGIALQIQVLVEGGHTRVADK